LFEAVRKRRGCRGFSKDQRIYIPATELYTYPDYLVLCGPPQFSDAHNDTILNPVLIIEVLSKRTANYDRGAKFGFYRSIPSLREYAVIDSRAIYAEHWKLINNHWQLAGEWRSKTGVMYFDSIEATLSLLDVYDGADTLMVADRVLEDAEPYGLPA
jgi:Uma2 family endonuclease